ncbi:hypothetical protein XM38_031630 [Halomicronema hongdechloris C2206]|uniref:Uncharacterized protein n=1 Tax=Halomicronema hongdechloris C2206 TaxID=1641165 RepID=A0A1V8NQM5_9CYAN|nr:DUF721 domain-containing protein [Halomicronema hongdechloris]ASC72208.1 hypothetical protein XM38_031630 [Halomicronema hongdechloris C2206]
MALDNLHSLIRRLEQQPSWQRHQQLRLLLREWPHIVGAAVAQHSRPVGVQRQILQVAVSTAPWAQTLTFERGQILAKLQTIPGVEITDIRFSPGLWSYSPSHSRARGDNELIKSHPSWSGPIDWTSNEADPTTAMEAFQRWAQQIRAQQRHQKLCPVCGSPCPPGELMRWQACGLCAAKRWGP